MTIQFAGVKPFNYYAPWNPESPNNGRTQDSVKSAAQQGAFADAGKLLIGHDTVQVVDNKPAAQYEVRWGEDIQDGVKDSVLLRKE